MYIDGIQVDFYGFQFGMENKKNQSILLRCCYRFVSALFDFIEMQKTRENIIIILYLKRFCFDSIRNYDTSSISSLFNWYVYVFKG